MACPNAGAVIAVEVFVEERIIAPVRILLKEVLATKHGAFAFAVAAEEPDEAAGEVPGNVPQGLRSVGLGHLGGQVLPVVVVELLQRLDHQVVYRKPHRAAPIRVAAEQAGARLRRLVPDREGRAVGLKGERVGLVLLRERA